MQPPVYQPSWSDDVKALYRHDMQEMWDRTLAPHIWNQYHNQIEIYLAIAARDGTPKRILDLGCAQGTLSLLLAERGHSVVAVDLRSEFLEYAQSRYTEGDISFVQGNALDFQREGEFDLIYANQIVEHMVYPEKLLTVAFAALKKHGTLVITTPNFHYLVNKLPSFTSLGDRAALEHLQFTSDGDGHFFAYSGEELSALMQSAGFQRMEVSCFESPLIAGHLKTRHVARVLPVGILRFADRLLLSVPYLSRYFAHQLMVVGEKRA